ncbi:spermidine synthase [Saccharopolyspora halophila]|uniref:Spermidine synthase n=1 Tax=Saccharopolyspora halophila TaxID=405551 RepID=A0ABN3G0J5_9PSEU
MPARFEELDWRETPIGVISLRRRLDPTLGVQVHEVKLDDEYLMSSLFTVAEIELARLGLAQVPDADLDVVVGGLGLGYTAQAVLAESRVRSLTVVEGLGEVIEWHRRGLLPLGEELTADPRNSFVHGDFFAMALGERGFDAEKPGRRVDAILVDIDHSPRHTLDSGHAEFYTPDGLRRLAAHLKPGGVFALWSDDPPDEEFKTALGEVFGDVRDHSVFFANPYGGPESANTIYTARLVA